VERLAQLAASGVNVVDPRQTWIANDVDLTRLHPGSILHPGTRLSGSRCFLGPGAEVGREGPAVLVDAVLDSSARVESGYVNGAVLLRGAVLGSNAHVRAGTLLEEEASTAHAVGLKHTLLLSFVTLGSLINFCDCLMAGGTSRQDHSEVGSGFIHFNFTPWGTRGDKATPSLIGDVVRGVFLREGRIFLGGSAGMIGPLRIGYGSIVGAGGVLRKDVAAGRLTVAEPKVVDLPLPIKTPRATVLDKGRRNVEYLGHLFALRAWYREVRLARAAAGPHRMVLEAAVETIQLAIDERVARLAAYLSDHGVAAPVFEGPLPPCPVALRPSEPEHLAWVRSLTDADVAPLLGWLESIVAAVSSRATIG
jgi:acetyltransferase-like isoleucine patch superfamily enzyme